ncbi:MAG TPA: hypothetical protein VGC41_19110, partial [Kofleriaceae bacterium]
MRSVGILVAVLSFGTGCTRTWSREAVQPNPLIHPTETLRISEKITIVTGDMDLYAPSPVQDHTVGMAQSEDQGGATIAHPHRWPLMNQAYFTMVSRDRLRFHVQIDHKWEE